MRKLLIVGCGEVARRTLPHLRDHYLVFALLREPAQYAWWRTHGARPILADLDHASSLKRISGLADIVLHFAPPPSHGKTDTRTRHLLAALTRGKSLPQRLVYVSTSGVYGDCAGQRIDETHAQHPTTDRALRRVDAEHQLRRFASRNGVCVSILRVPGIYAENRLPIERLAQRIPALRSEEDVFTNHIHADDLALLSCAAIRYGRANRCYNASDDSEMKMGDYFDLVAHRFGLPPPPRISRKELQPLVSPVQLSFLSESRRLTNLRIKKELHVRLRYPRVADGINATLQAWKR